MSLTSTSGCVLAKQEKCHDSETRDASTHLREATSASKVWQHLAKCQDLGTHPAPHSPHMHTHLGFRRKLGCVEQKGAAVC